MESFDTMAHRLTRTSHHYLFSIHTARNFSRARRKEGQRAAPTSHPYNAPTRPQNGGSFSKKLLANSLQGSNRD